MQVCTSLQTDNHASTPLLSFLQAGCTSCRPTNSVKALKARLLHEKLRQIKLIQNCSVADVVRHTVCNRELTNRSRMTNTCTRCKNHNFLSSTTHSLAEHDRSIRQFVLTSMIGSKLAKRTVHGSVNSLKASCQSSQFTETSHVHNIQSVQCYHSQKA